MKIEDGSDVDYDSKESKKNRYSWGWLGSEVSKDKLGWRDFDLKSKVIIYLRKICFEMYDRTYSTGETYQHFKYRVISHMGHHNCEICPKDSKLDSDLGWNGSILIQHKDKEYRAPWSVVHYIERHDYNPGSEIIDALFNGKLLTYDEVDGEKQRQFHAMMAETNRKKQEERQCIEDAKSPEQKDQDRKNKEWEKWAANKVQQLRDSGAIVT